MALETRIDVVYASLILRHVEMAGMIATELSYDGVNLYSGAAVYMLGDTEPRDSYSHRMVLQYCLFYNNAAQRSGGVSATPSLFHVVQFRQ